MSSMNTGDEREQVADLVRKLVTDDQLRRDFEADPRSATSASGIALSAEAADRIVQTPQLVPDVMARLESTDEVNLIFAVVMVTDE